MTIIKLIGSTASFPASKGWFDRPQTGVVGLLVGIGM